MRGYAVLLGCTTLVRLQGALDDTTADHATQTLTLILNHHPHAVLIDLALVTAMTPTGARTLTDAGAAHHGHHHHPGRPARTRPCPPRPHPSTSRTPADRLRHRNRAHPALVLTRILRPPTDERFRGEEPGRVRHAVPVVCHRHRAGLAGSCSMATRAAGGRAQHASGRIRDWARGHHPADSLRGFPAVNAAASRVVSIRVIDRGSGAIRQQVAAPRADAPIAGQGPGQAGFPHRLPTSPDRGLSASGVYPSDAAAPG